MRRQISTFALLVAWLCANGALWNVVQVVAWAKMFRPIGARHRPRAAAAGRAR